MFEQLLATEHLRFVILFQLVYYSGCLMISLVYVG